jgi:hypothetical protein
MDRELVKLLGIGNVSDADHHGNYFRLEVDGVPHVIYWAAGRECILRWDPEMRFNELIAVLSKLHDEGHISCTRDRMHLSEFYESNDAQRVAATPEGTG